MSTTSAEFIAGVEATLPELPDAKKHRFMAEFGLSPYDAALLTANRETADYFEATVAASGGQAKLSANWVMVELMAALNRAGIEIDRSPISPALLGGLVRRIADNTISGKIAKDVFEAMWNGEGDADEIIRNRGLNQVTDTAAIAAMIDEVLKGNPSQVSQYRQGKEQLLAFFVGQVMKKSKGKANPQQINEILKRKLAKA